MGSRSLTISFISLALFLPALAQGETRVFFSSKDTIEPALVRLIDDSQTWIDLALFEFRSDRLQRALKCAQSRGVLIRIVLDASRPARDLPAGEIRWLGSKRRRGRGVMHHKFALFDKVTVTTGSYNWTRGAEHANYENALMIDDPDVVASYEREFELLWSRARAFPRALKSDRIRVLRSDPPKL